MGRRRDGDNRFRVGKGVYWEFSRAHEAVGWKLHVPLLPTTPTATILDGRQ